MALVTGQGQIGLGQDTLGGQGTGAGSGTGGAQKRRASYTRRLGRQKMGYPLQTPTITSTIAVSGTTGSAVPLEGWELMGIDIPTLDSTTFKLQASLDGGVTFRDIYDGLGNQILSMPASTGARVIGSRELSDLVGYTHVQPVCGSNQNSSARTITFYRKGS